MVQKSKIPENAEKMLFAEDLMNYIMIHTVKATCTRISGSYRDSVYNAFNENISNAVVALYREVNMKLEIILLSKPDQHSVNLSTYNTYAKIISKKYSTDDFDARVFLRYCVRLAAVAVQFYGQGVIKAPDLAVTYIVNAINNVDMTTGGWVALNSLPEKSANIENDTVKQLSPLSTSDEEASSSNSERNLNNSSASYPILLRVGSSSYLNEDFKEHEVPIKKVLNKDFHQRLNSSRSSENKECCK